MRCKKCYKVIPITAEECQYCGQKYKPVEDRGQSLSFNDSKEDVALSDYDTLLEQMKPRGISPEEKHNRALWRKEKLTNLLIRLSPLLIIALIVGGLMIADALEPEKERLQYTLDAQMGYPVWAVVKKVEEPQYELSFYRRPDTGYFGGYSVDDLSEGSEVLCRCTDVNGAQFWLDLEYGEYLNHFAKGIPAEGIRILGTTKDPNKISDYDGVGLGNEPIFRFEAIDTGKE